MRREFGKIMVELAEKDPLIYLMVGDIGFGIFDKFKERFPDRYLNMGICEQSIVSASSGMALEGLKPYVYTITPFLLERAFEQVKLDVDQQKVNVKLVGYADYPEQGPTHSLIHETGLSGFLKNTSCYYPKSSEETKNAVIQSYHSMKPSFISLKEDKNFGKW